MLSDLGVLKTLKGLFLPGLANCWRSQGFPCSLRCPCHMQTSQSRTYNPTTSFFALITPRPDSRQVRMSLHPRGCWNYSDQPILNLLLASSISSCRIHNQGYAFWPTQVLPSVALPGMVWPLFLRPEVKTIYLFNESSPEILSSLYLDDNNNTYILKHSCVWLYISLLYSILCICIHNHTYTHTHVKCI